MNNQQMTPILPQSGQVPQGVLVQNFRTHADLDAAMEKLSQAGLPANAFFVVGHDLKQVEYFMGKLTYPRVALSSALSGASFGALIGVVTALVTGTSVLPHLASAVPLGIAIWMIFGILSFSRANKNGNFQTRVQMVPSAYSLMTHPSLAGQARQVLGSPAQMPTPAPQAPHSSPQAPAHPAAPQRPERIVGPEFNKDGSRAGGKFGLRIEDPEEYAKAVRTEPARPADTQERIEKIRDEQNPQRYGLKVENPRAVQEAVRPSPNYTSPAEARQEKREGMGQIEGESTHQQGSVREEKVPESAPQENPSQTKH